MRRDLIGGLSLLLILATADLRAQEQTAPQLTLEQAVQAAAERSPVLRAQRAEVEEARARLLTAQTFPFNPEVSTEAARRSAPGDSSTDRGVEVSQEIELGGQRGRRVAVAVADLQAAEARFRRNERLLAGRVAVAFAEAVRARELLRIEEADAELARELLAFEERRLEAGKVTQIDVNLARAAAGRSVRRVELARGAYLEARSVLAEATALAPNPPPEPVGGLQTGAPAPAPLEELLRLALENREDLLAFRREREAARAQIDLAQARTRPNLVARVFKNQEEGTDDIVGGGVAIAIPIFSRNRGEIAEARAAADRVEAQAEAAQLTVQQEVASAFARYQAASAAAAGLGQQVIGTLEENLRLLQRSLEEGKIDRTELFLFRREFVESQREYLDALSEAWQSRVELDLAAGRLPVPTDPNRSIEP